MVVDAGEEAEVADLIGRLGADRREALVLTQVLGLSYQEAAEVCNCPLGSVRSRVSRARPTLLRSCTKTSVAAFVRPPLEPACPDDMGLIS
jgi:RNA polymerase sigma-70 factor, ECF subfamily